MSDTVVWINSVGWAARMARRTNRGSDCSRAHRRGPVWLRIILLALSMSFCVVPSMVHANAPPLPEVVKQTHGSDLRTLGSGRFRWFGLHIYDAALWIPGQAWSWDEHFVLDIRYARDLLGKRIADASVDEITRLGLVKDAAKLVTWREFMQRAFPDVKKGEHITGFYQPGVGATFYHEGRITETVTDIEFARAFFSIWLDPRTREPKLRAKLLGLQ